MSKIKIGIIGMGRMGITHYSIINSHPDVEIMAVADTTLVVLSIIKKYIPAVKTYKHYKDLISESKPDAVLVCTPPNLHYQILKLAAEYQIHAFVEKPYTVNYKESVELADIFDDNQLVNQVGYVNRFNDIFHFVRMIINEGIIGDVIRFKSEMFSRTIVSENDNDGWRSSRNEGGGAIYEMASHAIDLVNFILGKPDKIIGTNMNNVYSEKVEDIVSSTFIYNSGCSGTIYINWSDESYRKPTNKLELFGKKGKIVADQHTMKLFLTEPNEKYKYIQGWNNVYVTDVFRSVPFYVRGNEFTRQLYHFVDLIQKKTENNICAFSDGVDTQFVINEMFKDYLENSK